MSETNEKAKRLTAGPTFQRERGGENVLIGAKVRARIAKAGGDVERKIDPDTSGRVPLPPRCSEVAIGGELVPTEARLRDTVTNPDYVTLDASRDRLHLASQAGVLELALDVSDTIDAANSLEKMLAHQMAAVHRALMKVPVSMEDLDLQFPRELSWQQRNVEKCRLIGAMTRLATVYQDGMLALQRVRSGGKQQVIVKHTVQHVQVNEGGQAVVAGKIAKGRTRKS